MTLKSTLLGMVCLGIALALGVVATAGEVTSPWWELDGAWTSEDPRALDGVGTLIVMTRTGPDSYSIVWKAARSPLFPGESKRSDYTGNVRRTGARTWEYAAMSYIQGSAGSVIGIAMIHGQFEMQEDGLLYHLSWGTGFALGQNPFTDPPAYGCFGPLGARLQRIPIVAPCQP